MADGLTTIYLALGSNMGDSAANIHKAVELLSARVTDITEAPIYTSKAVGYTDQPDFLNTALRGTTSLSPEELLVFVKTIEREIGRIHRFRWGPREIDIDIIFYGDTILDIHGLTIPHPRFTERDFVLRPIYDIDPDFVDPNSGQTVQALLKALPTDEQAIF